MSNKETKLMDLPPDLINKILTISGRTSDRDNYVLDLRKIDNIYIANDLNRLLGEFVISNGSRFAPFLRLRGYNKGFKEKDVPITLERVKRGLISFFLRYNFIDDANIKLFKKEFGDYTKEKSWEKLVDKILVSIGKFNIKEARTPNEMLDAIIIRPEKILNDYYNIQAVPIIKNSASTLQAALRRKLTQPPKQAAKTAAKTETKAVKNAAKSTMTEDEKRLERNRKAREKYAAKKAQK